MDHDPTPLRLGAEHLERDALPALLGLLRGAPAGAPLVLEVGGASRLPAPVLQALVAAQAEGREVRLDGAGEPLLLALATLDLLDAFHAGGIAA